MEPSETPVSSTNSTTPAAHNSETIAIRSDPTSAAPVASELTTGGDVNPQAAPVVAVVSDLSASAAIQAVAGGVESLGVGNGAIAQSEPETVALSKPTVSSVMFDIVANPSAVAILGYRANRPRPNLTDEQALLQAQIFDSLQRQGKTLESQADVYPWLLDQLLDSMAAD